MDCFVGDIRVFPEKSGGVGIGVGVTVQLGWKWEVLVWGVAVLMAFDVGKGGVFFRQFFQCV